MLKDRTTDETVFVVIFTLKPKDGEEVGESEKKQEGGKKEDDDADLD